MWSAHSLWITLGLPQSKVVCASQVYTAQALGCSTRASSHVSLVFSALPRSKPLRFSSTPQGHSTRWVMCFVPFPGLSSSGNQVFGKPSVPGGPCILFTCPVPATWFSGCVMRAWFQVCVCHLGCWFQTLLADVTHLESQEDKFISWESSYSLVEDVVSGRRRRWHPTPVLLPGKSHGQRSLVGWCPWGHEELDTTEWLHFHFSLSCIGEGNGNPLQCSCLENPRDGGA